MEDCAHVPRQCVFLPKFWLHCVRSVGNPNTLALSFQVVELKDNVRHMISWESSESLAVPVPTVATTSVDNNSSANLAMHARSPVDTNVPHSKPHSEYSFRKSSRQRPKCGFCLRFFCGEEMWVLQLKVGQPAALPDCPITIPKHLVCMTCCSRNLLKVSGDPETEITYPDGNRHPILTKEEFCDLQYYEYAPHLMLITQQSM